MCVRLVEPVDGGVVAGTGGRWGTSGAASPACLRHSRDTDRSEGNDDRCRRDADNPVRSVHGDVGSFRPTTLAVWLRICRQDRLVGPELRLTAIPSQAGRQARPAESMGMMDAVIEAPRVCVTMAG